MVYQPFLGQLLIYLVGYRHKLRFADNRKQQKEGQKPPLYYQKAHPFPGLELQNCDWPTHLIHVPRSMCLCWQSVPARADRVPGPRQNHRSQYFRYLEIGISCKHSNNDDSNQFISYVSVKYVYVMSFIYYPVLILSPSVLLFVFSVWEPLFSFSL